MIIHGCDCCGKLSKEELVLFKAKYTTPDGIFCTMEGELCMDCIEIMGKAISEVFGLPLTKTDISKGDNVGNIMCGGYYDYFHFRQMG